MKKESSNKTDNSQESAMPEQLKPYAFKPGVSGNPGGRPRSPLKDYVREKFAAMSQEDKEEFLKKVSPDIIWKMAEGNPDTALTGPDGADLIPATEERKKLKEVAHGTLRRI